MPDHEAAVSDSSKARRRALRSLWILLAVSMVAAASLQRAFEATASPVTGVRVALSGIVLVAALALAVRILTAFDRARRQGRPRPPGSMTE